MMSRAVIGLAAVVSACCGMALAETPPSHFNRRHFERYPGLWWYQHGGGEQLWKKMTPPVVVKATTDCVTPAAAMRIEFPDVPVADENGKTFRHGSKAIFVDAKGISFWVKGDGSDNYGRVTFGYDTSKPSHYFPLKDRAWHPVRLKLSDFNKPITTLAWLHFGLKPGAKRPTYYTVDKLEPISDFSSYTPEKDAKLKQAAAARPPGKICEVKDLKAFVRGGQNLARVKKKLKAREAVKIVVIGDSVTAGIQLWSIGKEPVKEPYRFRNTMAREIAKHYKYDDTHQVIEVKDKKDKERKTTNIHKFGGITVIDESRSGGHTRGAKARLNRPLAHKPDVFVVELGTNDSYMMPLKKFQANFDAILDKLAATGAEIVLMTNSPGAYTEEKEQPFQQAIIKTAEKRNLALVDMFGLFYEGVGPNAYTVYFSNKFHPNWNGHLLLGRCAAEVFY